MLNIKLSPESLCMLALAIGLDLIGVLLVMLTLDDFGTTDLVGIAIINTWLIVRNKEPRGSDGKKGAINNLKTLFTDKRTRLIVPTFTELIPYLGILPMWTLSVLFNLSEE